MEVPLFWVLVCHTGLLKQIVLNIGRSQLGVFTEVNTDEFTESRRVIIPDCLGVTVRLKDRVTHDNLVLNRHLLIFTFLRRQSTDAGKVLDDLLGVLGFTRTRFTSNQDGLVLPVLDHVRVGIVSNGEDVRRQLCPLLATVCSNNNVWGRGS